MTSIFVNCITIRPPFFFHHSTIRKESSFLFQFQSHSISTFLLQNQFISISKSSYSSKYVLFPTFYRALSSTFSLHKNPVSDWFQLRSAGTPSKVRSEGPLFRPELGQTI